MAKQIISALDEVYSDGVLVSSTPRAVDVTADAVRYAAHQALRAARAANRGHRGRPNPSAAQIRGQVAALTEQVHLLTALVLSLTGAPAELDDDEVLTP